MSFVYTDISGFTMLCESADPKALVPALNRYLSGMTSIIYDHKGTVAGFIGDAVLAFWGAPLDDPEQAVHALRSALAMSRFAKDERRKAAAEGLDFGRTRIGVHRGLATVGNFGGAARLEYMAHGDAVNTVARLEGANKYFNTDIAASEAVTAEAGDIPLRPVGDVMLRGKAHSVAIFEPAAEDSPGLADYLAAFELLRQGSPQALGAFEALHRRQPEDPLAAYHLERLRRGETGITIVLEDK
jgi:adenylate cyclase